MGLISKAKYQKDRDKRQSRKGKGGEVQQITGLQILRDIKTSLSIGQLLAMEFYYECLKLMGHSKRVPANIGEMLEKLIRVNTHLAENRVENCAGLVWDPGNKKKTS